MTKLTERQIEVMRFLNRSYPYVWISHELDQFDHIHTAITASKHGPAIRALCKKGLAEFYPKLDKYACKMTELGHQIFLEYI